MLIRLGLKGCVSSAVFVCALLTDTIFFFFFFLNLPKLACCSLQRQLKSITQRLSAIFSPSSSPPPPLLQTLLLLPMFLYRGLPLCSCSHRVHPYRIGRDSEWRRGWVGSQSAQSLCFQSHCINIYSSLLFYLVCFFFCFFWKERQPNLN